MKSAAQPLLEVSGLYTGFQTAEPRRSLLTNIHFHIKQGETVAVIGESGSGKSTMALSIMRLLEPPLCIQAGSVRLEGQELLQLPDKEMKHIRGQRMAVVFQDPLSSFHPMLTLGSQLMECIKDGSRRANYARCLEMLERVGLPNPEKMMKSYPFELSGGMLQRVMIAMGLLNRPKLLIADEPTTALDVTVQAGILSLLKDVQREFGMGLLFISHDLGVVSELADRIVVMRQGEIVECEQAAQLLQCPAHPYTRHLLEMVPILGQPLPEQVRVYG
ncbi:ABC transporter ATP-binding protein [Paenibacillus thalictri]|uniref:ABC transporter ATP-binding protein n=1 Tax=Paenibacillus thalictri TaxID=2527873 RepID=A0A4Q9DF26_9BACL|nr:ABC transporter ATP-binding protein [Paenibacillus thalictri]TBL68205.1 ABC transporter ATP-binding protein [Paenibacillus thalictri]